MDQSLDPPWVNPENFQSFIESLRHAGYNIGVQQHIDAQQLLLSLAASDGLSADPRQLATLLGPLLCSTPTEQQEFDYRFDEWLTSLNKENWTHAESEEPTTLTQDLNDVERKSRFWRWLITIISGLLLIGIAYTMVQFVREDLLLDMFRPKATTTATPEPTSTLSAAPLPPINPETVQPTPTSFPTPTLTPTPTPTWTWIDIILAFNRIKAQQKLGLSYSTWLLASLLVGIAGYYFWLLRRAQLYLNRKGSSQEPQIEQLNVSSFSETLVPAPAIFEIARNMRRRSDSPSNALDIAATVNRTVQMGGWISPVYQPRRAAPEYLLLIDRAHLHDHQTQFVQEIITRLIQHEVYIDYFYFDNDPRLCFSANPGEAPKQLDELFARYPAHRLVLFASSTVLLNPATGALSTWFTQLAAWPERALMTPVPIKHWGTAEMAIAAHFKLLPASISGLSILASGADNGHLPITGRKYGDIEAATEAAVDSFPQSIRIRPQRWLDQQVPDEASIQQLTTELKHYLGAAGYYWLSACSVYPAIHANLTLALGHLSRTVTQRSLLDDHELFLKLARLPWFRHAYMPDWLRSALIADLPSAQKREIKKLLERILLSALNSSDQTFTLDIAQEQNAGTSALARALLLLLGVRGKRSNIIKDSVFLDFMLGKPLALAVRLPQNLKRLFNQISRNLMVETVERAIEATARSTASVNRASVRSLIWIAGILLICLLGAGSWLVLERGRVNQPESGEQATIEQTVVNEPITDPLAPLIQSFDVARTEFTLGEEGKVQFSWEVDNAVQATLIRIAADGSVEEQSDLDIETGQYPALIPSEPGTYTYRAIFSNEDGEETGSEKKEVLVVDPILTLQSDTNFRTGNSLEHEVIEQLKSGHQLRALAKPDNNGWIYAQSLSNVAYKGWILIDLVSHEGDLYSLPLASAGDIAKVPTATPMSTPPPTDSMSDVRGNTSTLWLLRPPNGDAGNQREFCWAPATDFALEAGERYELIFWKDGGDPNTDGRGVVGVQTGLCATVAGSQIRAVGLPVDTDLNWAVRRVIMSPYSAKELLSETRIFRFRSSVGLAAASPDDSSGMFDTVPVALFLILTSPQPGERTAGESDIIFSWRPTRAISPSEQLEIVFCLQSNNNRDGECTDPGQLNAQGKSLGSFSGRNSTTLQPFIIMRDNGWNTDILIRTGVTYYWGVKLIVPGQSPRLISEARPIILD